jgi:OCT family organic cation transporter-like MFS transporter 3
LTLFKIAVEFFKNFKAAANLTKISRRNRGNGAEVTSAHLRQIPREENRKPTSYLTLFTTRKLTAYTLVMCSLVFATGASVSAYILQVSLLAGDPFIKFLLYGFLRFYIPPLIYLMNKCDWFGRRQMVLLPLTAVFLCFAFVAIVKFFDSQTPFEFYGLLAGAVICNCLWAGIGQYQIELFPTVVRSSATSLTSLSDPLASVMVPPLIYLQRYWPTLPYLFVTSAISVALLSVYFVLPETKGLLVPDTIEAMDGIGLAPTTNQFASTTPRWSPVRTCCAEDQALLVDNMENNQQESDEE